MATTERVCSGCGCADSDACVVERKDGGFVFCWWVTREDGSVVCSACAFGRRIRRSVEDHRQPAGEAAS